MTITLAALALFGCDSNLGESCSNDSDCEGWANICFTTAYAGPYSDDAYSFCTRECDSDDFCEHWFGDAVCALEVDDDHHERHVCITAIGVFSEDF